MGSLVSSLLMAIGFVAAIVVGVHLVLGRTILRRHHDVILPPERAPVETVAPAHEESAELLVREPASSSLPVVYTEPEPDTSDIEETRRVLAINLVSTYLFGQPMFICADDYDDEYDYEEEYV
jgi:hypothetical protein